MARSNFIQMPFERQLSSNVRLKAACRQSTQLQLRRCCTNASIVCIRRTCKSEPMRRSLAFLTACLFLPSCGNNGWRYDTNPSWPGAIYDFDDGNKSKLVFRCHRGPVASLTEFYSDHGSFKLTVDGKTSSVLAEQFEGILIVEDPSAINDIARAQSTIMFASSGAVRKVPASALIAKFLGDCSRLRKRYPAQPRE
jgi:hypothetical protein